MRSARIVLWAGIVAGFGLSAPWAPADAKEVTLRAISYTPKGSVFSQEFERFVDKVNAEGAGIVKINYLGGAPQVMPPTEVGAAVSTGVVDMANVACSLCIGQFPIATATFFSDLSIKEMRATGIWDTLNRLYNQKMNAYYLARTQEKTQMSLFMNKKIDKPDLTGFKVRTSPWHNPFVVALGGTPVATSLQDAHTALERGVVDGTVWPTIGIFDFGLQGVTKYRVDPPFWSLDVSVLVNLDAWNKKLDAQQRAFLTKAAAWLEEFNTEGVKLMQRERKRQEDFGMQVITFKGKDCQRYVQSAYDAAWAVLIERDPSNARMLKEKLYSPERLTKTACQ
jgi:TRAP-type C4-dicarboxylate transport system substrate-binding protein